MASYVSLENLQLYDEKLKAKISADDAVILQSSKDYADSLAVNYATATQGAIAEANAQAIVELQEGLGAVTDTYVDPDANNKYNGETGNVELYLNDGSYTQEQITTSESDNWSITFTGNSNSITLLEEEWNRGTCLPERLKELGYPEGTYFTVTHIIFVNRIPTETTSNIEDFYNYGQFIDNDATLYANIPEAGTKVEVDMNDLVAKIDAIESVTSEDIEELFK